MSPQPPPALADLLIRLGIATSGGIWRARRFRRVAGELRQFESAWVDALLRSRKLTCFQAREINAGRGRQLFVGPYLLCEKLPGPPYLETYRAKHCQSQAIVRLAVQRGTDLESVHSFHREESRQENAAQLIGEARERQTKNQSYVAPWIEGRTISEWLIVSGRFAPDLVLEIAQSMLVKLAAAEAGGRCHGDIAPWNVLLSAAGDTVLLNSGLRAIVHKEEGFAFADLPPEAYDYLAPERIVSGTPPNVSSDIYACGCLWWQMLAGRPPLSGGDSLTKLRAAASDEIAEVRRFAPETPAILADAISACLQKEPQRRPKSMAALAELLGPPSKDGRPFVARTLASRTWTNRFAAESRYRQNDLVRNKPMWIIAVLVCISMILLFCGPALRRWRQKANVQQSPKHHSRAVEVPAEMLGLPKTPAPLAVRQSPHPPDATQGYLDRQVQTAGYLSVTKPPAARRTAVDFVLETNAPQCIETLSLERGERVIGRSGRRATIVVPPGGLKLAGEEIRLENIDFTRKAGISAENPALILFSGSRAEFRGCRFFTTQADAIRPAAVCWMNDKKEISTVNLASGRLRFANCIFERVGEGVECRRRGAIVLDAKNCLMHQTAALLRIEHQPELDEPISLTLEKLTMRETGPVLDCRRTTSSPSPVEILVQAENCVFSPIENVPLLAFEGPDPPDAVLRDIRWSGSSSLIATETPVGAWKTPTGRWEPTDDTTLAIAGLIRSPLEFAENGAKDGNSAAAARLQNWQAPLPTPDPPGVNVESLPSCE